MRNDDVRFCLMDISTIRAYASYAGLPLSGCTETAQHRYDEALARYQEAPVGSPEWEALRARCDIRGEALRVFCLAERELPSDSIHRAAPPVYPTAVPTHQAPRRKANRDAHATAISAFKATATEESIAEDEAARHDCTRRYLNLPEEASASLADLSTGQIKTLYRAMKRGEIVNGWNIIEPDAEERGYGS